MTVLQRRMFDDIMAMLAALPENRWPEAWWEVGRQLHRDLAKVVDCAGRHVYVIPADNIPHGQSTLMGLPVEFVPGDQIALKVPVMANPYDRPRHIPDPSLTLAAVSITIAYEARGAVRCVTVMPGGI
jgi:hypothetical protein